MTFVRLTLTLSLLAFTLHARKCLCYPLEQRLHVVPYFRACLDEHQVVLLCLLFSLCCGDLPLVVQVRLIAYQNNNDIVASLASDIIHPLARVFKGLLVGDVVHDDRYAGVANVGGNQGSEPLLTGCVPEVHSLRQSQTELLVQVVGIMTVRTFDRKSMPIVAWYVLSNESYMNRVINDVLPTVYRI
jgi:hypothetical protein